MDEQIQEIDKDKILSTPARRQLFQARMEGKNIKQAAEIAGIGYNYARELCAGLARHSMTDLGINALVKQEQQAIQAKTAEKLEITETSQVRRFQALSIGAEQKGQYGPAVSAEDRITSICGLYERDNAQKQTSLAVFLKGIGEAQPNLSENRQSMIDSVQVPDTQGVTSEAKDPVPASAEPIPDVVGEEAAE